MQWDVTGCADCHRRERRDEKALEGRDMSASLGSCTPRERGWALVRTALHVYVGCGAPPERERQTETDGERERERDGERETARKPRAA